MSLFDEKHNIEKLFFNKWVMWVHPYTLQPKTIIQRSINAAAGTLFPKHCAVCLNMNGSCFLIDKCPQIPLHENCHCAVIDVDFVNFQATCDIKKFTKYIFSEKSKGKKELFQSWGFSVIDSEFLKNEFLKQGLENYELGNYELGKIDPYGQRITIEISLYNKFKNKEVNIKTGWMVYPNGEIVLVTPYGGK